MTTRSRSLTPPLSATPMDKGPLARMAGQGARLLRRYGLDPLVTAKTSLHALEEVEALEDATVLESGLSRGELRSRAVRNTFFGDRN